MPGSWAGTHEIKNPGHFFHEMDQSEHNNYTTWIYLYKYVHTIKILIHEI